MFRSLATRVGGAILNTSRNNLKQSCAVQCVRYGHSEETSDEFDNRYEAYLNRQDIDSWELRKAMNDLQGYDMVPEPRIIVAAMKACRRINDYGLAVRYLEAVQNKCGPHKSAIWPYLLQEIKPTLDELGILTPEEMGYDKPELACVDVMDMH